MFLTNAYFIVEAVRALAEEAGSLEAVGTRGLPQQVVSGGIRAVVQRRLDRVPEWARPLLNLAAVAGRQVDLEIFSAIAPELAAWLQVCLDAAVLEVHDAQWRFSHDKLREGLLASLSTEERRRLHRQIGETVEQVHGTLDASSVTLAYHFEQALDLPKAARFTAQAGTAALRQGALHEAVALLERAKKLLEQADAPLLHRTAVMRRLVRAYYGVDRKADCMTIWREGMAALGKPVPKSARRRLLAMVRETAVEIRHRLLGAKVAADEHERTIAKEIVALSQGSAEAIFKRMDEALLVVLYSLHAAELSGEIEPQINCLSRLGYAAYILPLPHLGKLYLARAARLLAAHPQYEPRSAYHPFVGYMHGGEGQWQQCLQAYSVWLHNLELSQDEPLQCLAYSSRSSALLSCGRLAEALADAECCEQIGRKIGSANNIGTGLAYRAVALLYRGEVATACALFREAQSYMEQSSNLVAMLSSGAGWSLAALRAGQPELALEQLDKALGRMAESVPASSAFVDGYVAALEVALHFYLNAPTAPQRASAEPRLLTALYHMVRFAHKFPIGWPRVLLAIGRILWSHGQPRWSLRALALSLRHAESRSMPYEQALAHLWLGRVLTGTADGQAPTLTGAARAHLSAAEQLLSSRGYGLDLPEVRRLLA